MRNRFVVRPCDDENGRTWDVWDTATKGSIHQRIRTRAKARVLAAEYAADEAEMLARLCPPPTGE